MRVRVVKEGGFWVGQVYGTWSIFFGLQERVGWGSVTDKCYTRWGAEIQLRIWKRTKCPKEFEL